MDFYGFQCRYLTRSTAEAFIIGNTPRASLPLKANTQIKKVYKTISKYHIPFATAYGMAIPFQPKQNMRYSDGVAYLQRCSKSQFPSE